MHTELSIDSAVLWGFLIVLARVSGFITFVPLPGMNAAPASARIVFAIFLTMCLLPLWPKVSGNPVFGDFALWIGAEFAMGLVTGIGLSIVLEGVQLGAQTIGLQAGFSYASTVDPSTQADTAVLQTILELLTGMIVFTVGIDVHFFKLLSLGLDSAPTGAAISKAFSVEAAMQFGSLMFNTGMRLAIPVIGSLVLVDLAFALLSKVHAQLQLLSFSFSIKMLAGLAVCAATLPAYPRLLMDATEKTIAILSRLLS